MRPSTSQRGPVRTVAFSKRSFGGGAAETNVNSMFADGIVGMRERHALPRIKRMTSFSPAATLKCPHCSAESENTYGSSIRLESASPFDTFRLGRYHSESALIATTPSRGARNSHHNEPPTSL